MECICGDGDGCPTLVIKEGCLECLFKFEPSHWEDGRSWVKNHFTLSKQRGGKIQRLELFILTEDRRRVRLKGVVSKIFSTESDSKYLGLWGQYVLHWNTQLHYYNMKAAIDVYKWMSVAVFQWNYISKNRWYDRFGPWAIVCPAPDHRAKQKVLHLETGKRCSDQTM